MDQDAMVFERVKEMLMDYSKSPVPFANANGDTRIDSLEIDSIALAMIFVEFERQYDIVFENEDITAKYVTLSDLVNTMREKIANREPPPRKDEGSLTGH